MPERLCRVTPMLPRRPGQKRVSGSTLRRSSLGLLGASAVTLVLLHAASLAQTLPPTPGGFLEKAGSKSVRPLWTPAQIRAFLPPRGKFTFPAPYNTDGIRLTNDSDCVDAETRDCIHSVGYSYWRNINNHAGSDTMLIFVALERRKGGSGPTLFSYNKSTGDTRNLGPMFSQDSPHSWSNGEGWYFSAAQPTTLYMADGPKLLRYDVMKKRFQTVFDVRSQFGDDKYIWQTHSSDDDRVHSATLRMDKTWAMLGCLVYQENTKRFLYYRKLGDYDECQIDKSGRWLVIKENVDGRYDEDNRVIDLQTGVERVLLDEDGAGGHSDTGYGYFVADDNRNKLPGTVRVWKFDRQPFNGPIVFHRTDYHGGIGHISHANAKPDVPTEQQYVCGGSAVRAHAPHLNEILCFSLDTSLEVLVVAPLMTDPNAPGGGDDYVKQPKGNLDVTGQYFIWTSNMGGKRLDAFLVKIPAQLLLTAPRAASAADGAAQINPRRIDGR